VRWPKTLGTVLGAAGLAGASGCSSAAPPRAVYVAPAPPPKDDGNAAKGGEGGDRHAAALEQLKVAPLGWRVDKQHSLRIDLPDASHWTRVKFWGVPSLVGFRYGKDHHAIVAAFITHVDDNSVRGACPASFEKLARPVLDSFEVELERQPPRAESWRGGVVDILSVDATTATLVDHESYAAAFATYPAWTGACLVVGVAVPAREDLERARAVRDRFAESVLTTVDVRAKEEPTERY
jgi:hypothetical protein